MRRKVTSIYVALSALMAVPAIAQMRDSRTIVQERLIAGCIHQSARGKPWLEKTLWALRDQEGGWIGAEVRSGNGSYDLGPMQINSWWVPRIAQLVGQPVSQARHWLRDDPCFNVEAARWLILNALVDTADYWKAVGMYHSPTAWRQKRYIHAIARRVNRDTNRRLHKESNFHLALVRVSNH